MNFQHHAVTNLSVFFVFLSHNFIFLLTAAKWDRSCTPVEYSLPTTQSTTFYTCQMFMYAKYKICTSFLSFSSTSSVFTRPLWRTGRGMLFRLFYDIHFTLVTEPMAVSSFYRFRSHWITHMVDISIFCHVPIAHVFQTISSNKSTTQQATILDCSSIVRSFNGDGVG